MTIPTISNQIPTTPIATQDRVRALSQTKQQIFEYIYNQAVLRSQTADLTTCHNEIADETLNDLINPNSRAYNAQSLSEYILGLLNDQIATAICHLHGFTPPFPTANTITQAEEILGKFRTLHIQQREKDEHDFIRACSNFEGRETLRVQHEQWELGERKTNPIPYGFSIPNETDPYSIQIAKERRIQRSFTREINDENAFAESTQTLIEEY